ncbi:hypothetical protein [Serratia sp. M24T3]|uniref:hypothetical protein n=1 Tax=Serratia sp. M24T3 TaxID=932213 RepID=UPI00025B9F65|nr:hypothetical protein [Serratia sp. M24T3]EIC83961.1 hypothetical protein SPM24T3_13630 [Serratia sp. M24T3]
MQTRSLYLDPDTWDLVLDGNGSLKTVTNPYSVAQDVACACKTILGEVIYDTTIGIPYFDTLLGRPVTTTTLSSWLQKQATRLSYVQSATVTLIPNRATRDTSGYISITDSNGTSSTLVL